MRKDDKYFPELDARLLSKNGKSTLRQTYGGNIDKVPVRESTHNSASG